MTDTAFLTKLDDLYKMASRKNLVIRSKVPSGATEANIREVEDYISFELSSSMKTFLKMHDGFAVSLCHRGADDPSQLFSISELHVFGTAQIIKSTQGLRDYLSGIDLEAIGEESQSPNICMRSNRCIALASIGQNWKAAFSIDEPREDGEFSIVKVDVECMQWLSYLEHRIADIEIALTLDEFVERSFAQLLEKQTFVYWQ